MARLLTAMCKAESIPTMKEDREANRADLHRDRQMEKLRLAGSVASGISEAAGDGSP